MPDDKLTQYYQYLKSNGENLPEEDVFREKLSDRERSDRYYDYLKGKNLSVPDSKDQFYEALNVKKKGSGQGSAGATGALPSDGEKKKKVVAADIQFDTGGIGMRGAFEEEKPKDGSFRTVKAEEIKVEVPEKPEYFAQYSPEQLKEMKDRYARKQQYKKELDTTIPLIESRRDEARGIYERNFDEYRRLTMLGDMRGPVQQKRYEELTPVLEQSFGASENLTSTLNLLKSAQKYIDTSDAGVLESMVKSDAWAKLLDFGMNNIIQDFDMVGLVKKFNKGEGLTDEEQTALYAYGLRQAVYQDTDKTMSSMIGGGIAETIPFMVQFAISGPAAASGKAAAAKTVEKLLANTARQKLANYTARAIGALTGAAIRVPMMSDFYEGIAGEQIGTIQPEITEDGKLRGIPIEGTQKSPLQATAKSFASTMVTTLTEDFGQVMQPLATKTTNRFVKMMGGNPMATRIGNKTLDQIKSATGFNGWMGEFTEEILEGYGQAVIDRDQKLSDVWDTKSLLSTAIITGVISGSFSGANYVTKGNAGDKALAIRDLRKSEEAVGDRAASEIDTILRGESQTTNVEQLDAYIKKKKSEGATEEDLRNIITYATNKARAEEMNRAIIDAQDEVDRQLEEKAKEAPKETAEAQKEALPEVKPEAAEVSPIEAEKPLKMAEKAPVAKETEQPETVPLKEDHKGKVYEKPEMEYPVRRYVVDGNEVFLQRREGMAPSETGWVQVEKDRSGTWQDVEKSRELAGMPIGYTQKEAISYIKGKAYEKEKLQAQQGKGAGEEIPTEEVREGVKETGQIKTEGYAKEQQGGPVRGQGAAQGQVEGISNKDLSGIYGSKLQDRQEKQKQSVQEIGDYAKKPEAQKVKDAQSVQELSYLLDTGQVQPSPTVTLRQAVLDRSGKTKDVSGRVPQIEVQRAAQKIGQMEKSVEGMIEPSRIAEIKEKKGELWESIGNRLGRMANIKYAVGEDGKAGEFIKEAAATIVELAEIGALNLELGVRNALEQLKKIIGSDNPEALKLLEDNMDAIEKELQGKGFKQAKPVSEEVKPKEEKKPIEKEVPEGKKRRRAAKQFLEDTSLSEEIREGLSEDAINYVPISNEVTENEARVIINTKKEATGSLDKSVQDVTRTDNRLSPRVRVTMAYLLVEELNREMQKKQGAERIKLQEDAINVAESITRYGTELGQGVQAFNIWAKLNPDSMVHKFNKDLEGIRGEGLTEKEEKELRNHARKVKDAKEGFQKQKAIQDMLAYQMRLEGISWKDVGMSVWYAHVLSGYTTQMLNGFANMAETASEVAVSMLYRPKSAPWLLKGLFSGYGRGMLEAWSTLKTGYAPVKHIKYDMSAEGPSVLEAYQGFRMFNRKWNPFKYHKYVTRVMSAVDTFFYHGLKGMRTYELMHRQVMGEGKSYSETNRLVNDKLGKTKERVAEARQRAKDEVEQGRKILEAEREQLLKDLETTKSARQEEIIRDEIARVDREIALSPAYKVGSVDYKRRVWEIMEETVTDETLEDADDIASRGTFNYATEGQLGKATDMIASLSNSKGFVFKGVKFVVPFTRIISNVANRYLDYTPVGFYRGFKGGIGPSPRTEAGKSKYSRKYTMEEQNKEFIKASLGTLAAVTLFMLTGSGDEDDEAQGPFEITAGGTGDFRKNYNLKSTGWQPYSIRVGDSWYSYANTPLAIPMSVVGTVRDMKNYRGKDLNDEGMATKVSLITWNTMQYFKDMTFLKSLSEFMGNFNEEDPEQVVRYLKRFGANIGKGFVMPNLFTQVSRQVQSWMDMPMKEATAVWQQFYRDVPVARNSLNDMVNGLGEPVVPDTDRYVSGVVNDPVWELIVKNNAWVGKPSKNVRVFDSTTGQDRPLSDDEYYGYAKLRGQKLKGYIKGNLEALQAMDKASVQEYVDDYKKRSAKEAKADLLFGPVSMGLAKVKKENPEAFDVLKDYKGFYEPQSSRSVWVGDKQRYMVPAELKEYRDLSLEYYMRDLKGATKNFDRKFMDKLAATEEVDDNIVTNSLAIEMKDVWQSALSEAYYDMVDRIESREMRKSR